MMKTMIMIIAVAEAAVDEKRTRVLQTSSTEKQDYASMRGYEACNHDGFTERDCLAIGCCQWAMIGGGPSQYCATAVNDGAFCRQLTETPNSAPTNVTFDDLSLIHI